MKDKHVNSDKLLREKLQGYAVPPPPHIWANVQGQMAAQKRHKRMVYAAWIATAAVVVLAFIAGWYLNDKYKIEPPLSVEQRPDSPVPQNTPDVVPHNSPESAKVILNEATEIVDTEDYIVETDYKPDQKELVASNVMETSFFTTAREMDRDEGTEFKSLGRINAVFDNAHSSTVLAERWVPGSKSESNNVDELIMANNIVNYERELNNEKGWKMGMHISPAYSSTVANHSQSYAQIMNTEGDGGNGSVGGGFSVQYKTTKKLRIESGIYYAQSGQKSGSSMDLFAKDYEYAGPGFSLDEGQISNGPAPGISNVVNMSNGNMLMNSTAGVIEMRGAPKGAQVNTSPEMVDSRYANTLVTDGSFSQVFDFVEIPLYLRYSLLDKKFGIEIMGGLNAGIVVGNKAYIDNSYGLQNVGKTQDISTLNLSGTAGIGANYSFGKHISVAFEPRLNYYLNSINSNPNIAYRPYRIGFYTGLYYEF